jgi:hypothetical protein
MCGGEEGQVYSGLCNPHNPQFWMKILQSNCVKIVARATNFAQVNHTCKSCTKRKMTIVNWVKGLGPGLFQSGRVSEIALKHFLGIKVDNHDYQKHSNTEVLIYNHGYHKIKWVELPIADQYPTIKHFFEIYIICASF